MLEIDPQIENSKATKMCVACENSMPNSASLCATCGTRQNPTTRNFFKIVALFGGLATVLSLVTAAVALAPLAYAGLFPAARPSIFTMSFDTREMATRRFGIFDLYNAGNQDAYVTKLILQPDGNLFSSLNPVTISVYDVVLSASSIEKRIGLISSVTPNPPRVRLLINDQYSNLYNSMREKNVFSRNCFLLLPLNASKHLVAPENGRFRYDIASTTLAPSMEYFMVGNDENLEVAQIDNFYVEAAIYFKESCIPRLGGNEAYFAAIVGD